MHCSSKEDITFIISVTYSLRACFFTVTLTMKTAEIHDLSHKDKQSFIKWSLVS